MMDKPIKVLMVDDEAQFRATTEKLLARKGFQTLMAENGDEAIEQLQGGPDVVILDIRMPGMDGHQVLKKIKEHSPDLPIIMLTGHGALPSAKEALEEGAFDYLTKPCDIDVLAAKIEEACKREKSDRLEKERCVEDVMIPLDDYTTLNGKESVKAAISKLKSSFASRMSTSRIMETGHRSILVLDENGDVQGVLAITDLLQAMMPAYLSAPKPSMADSVQYSPMFWKGMFRQSIKTLAGKKINEIMSPAPPTIDAAANLMEAAHGMVKTGARRMTVTSGGKVVGAIREQDLFFEMERILLIN
jgi:DNA-binding response OmpR family regulator